MESVSRDTRPPHNLTSHLYIRTQTNRSTPLPHPTSTVRPPTQSRLAHDAAMLDPFPAPPVFLVRLVKPLADALHLYTLPLHVHEILCAAAFYTSISHVVSPFISARIAPNLYPRMSRRNRLNWDVHVVSFIQSLVINGLSLWVIWCDEERKVWRSNADGVWQQRTWGYLGSSGLCQSFALGYFLWDLVMCTRHTEIFGIGMFAHALSAVAVFGIGYVSLDQAFTCALLVANGADSGPSSTSPPQYSSSMNSPVHS